MKPKVYSSEAIVLAKINYSEADRIFILFTKDYGKLFVLAKSVRKPKSRKRGALDVFNHVKFSAARGKNLDIITEVEVINSHNGIRDDLKKVSVAYFIAETAGRIIREEEENKELFSLINSYLKRARKEQKLLSLRKDFIEDVLILMGFWPRGKPMSDHDKVLESVLEKKMATKRVGKRLFSKNSS